MTNRKKFTLGLVVTFLAIVASPSLLQKLGWIGPLHKNATIIILLAAGGLLLKLFFADIAADGEFLFHKNGFDNCIVVFGAILTAVALQLQSDVDLFPGLATVPFLSALGSSRSIQLFFLFVVALIASVGTARIAGAIKRAKTEPRRLGAFSSYVIGVVMLAIYVLILISKG